MSLEFIPINLYTDIYHHAILFITLMIFLHSDASRMGSIDNLSFVKVMGWISLAFVVLYMGFRPIDGVFVDMVTYARTFERLQHDSFINFKDPIFGNFMLISSKLMSSKTFFFVCALLYVIPLFFISAKWFEDFWFYSFIFLIGSFSFWGYGVNGIRNGIATSFFLLGVSRDNRIAQGLWLFLSLGFHFSMLLPVAGFVLGNIIQRPKFFLIIWLLAIPISYFGGGFWESYISSLGIDDPRLSYFTQEIETGRFSKVGFRWDFLIYSATGVLAGWYYIYKLRFYDKVYHLLFNTFLFANSFWILVIRVNYSNRFAYLSWFLMALIFVYPLLKRRLILYQHKAIGVLLLAYYSFTYTMNVLL